MASRRLAISSLLCDDDAPPSVPSTPVSHPQQQYPRSPVPVSPPKPLRVPSPQSVVLAPHLLRPRAEPAPHAHGHDRLPQSSHAREYDSLPLSLQSGSIRRHTPSPELVPATPIYASKMRTMHMRKGKTREGARQREDARMPSPPPVIQHRYDPLSADRQSRQEPPSSHPRSYPQPSPYQYMDSQQHYIPPSSPSPPPLHLSHSRTPNAVFLNARIPSQSPSSQSTVSLASQHLGSSPTLIYSPQQLRGPASPAEYYRPPVSQPIAPSHSHFRPPSQPQPQPLPHLHSQHSQSYQPSAQRFPHMPYSDPSSSSSASMPSPTYSPPLPRPTSTSVSSSPFPKTLLNPPVQPSLGGLDALVHAATVERRRLSGENTCVHERDARSGSGSSAYKGSPDLMYRRSPETAFRTPVQEPAPRAPPTSLFIPSDYSSSSRISMEPSPRYPVESSLRTPVDPPVMASAIDERPLKRRRRSDQETRDAISAQLERQRKGATTSPEVERSLASLSMERLRAAAPTERPRVTASPTTDWPHMLAGPAVEWPHLAVDPNADAQESPRWPSSPLVERPRAVAPTGKRPRTAALSPAIDVPKQRKSHSPALVRPPAPASPAAMEIPPRHVASPTAVQQLRTTTSPIVNQRAMSSEYLPGPSALPPPREPGPWSEGMERAIDDLPARPLKRRPSSRSSSRPKTRPKAEVPDAVLPEPVPLILPVPQAPDERDEERMPSVASGTLDPPEPLPIVYAPTPPVERPVVAEPVKPEKDAREEPKEPAAGSPPHPPSPVIKPAHRSPTPSPIFAIAPVVTSVPEPQSVPIVPAADVSNLLEPRDDPVIASVTPSPPQVSPPSPSRAPTRPKPEPSITEPAAPTAMDVEMDVNTELARAIEPIIDTPTPPVSTEPDVDDELLSLVGDTQPRRDSKPKSTHSAKHAKDKATVFPPATLHPSLSSSSQVKAERESMPPPPIHHPGVRDGEMIGERSGTPKVDERSAGSKKKSKSQVKSAQPKPRPKASGSSKSKSKLGPTKEKDKEREKDMFVSAPSARSKKAPPAAAKKSVSTAVSAARSRSTSVLPGLTSTADGKADKENLKEKEKPCVAEPEDEEEEDAEDKLYCVCKTSYDDEKVMIACDRCDEWYHTQCVNMADLEVDLVDQFICPPCVAKDPHLHLRTTWKKRCLYGQKQRDPNSLEACHRPARGAFSKYCSDECGQKYMESRIAFWEGKGGDRQQLWDTVKNAERREGVVVSARLAKAQDDAPGKMDVDGEEKPIDTAPGVVKPKKAKRDRELERLHAHLDAVVEKREQMKKEMDIVVWRERLTELAVQRSEKVDACGWDQRLCFGDEEVAEFGAGVLESYEDAGQGGTDAMHVDGAAEEGEWWCQGKRKCDRHAGWQKLRIAEVEFEKEMKDQALEKLTTKEREIRKRVEDIIDPQARLAATNTSYTSPPKHRPVEPKPMVNGHSKTKPNGDPVKKGRKKKFEVM